MPCLAASVIVMRCTPPPPDVEPPAQGDDSCDGPPDDDDGDGDDGIAGEDEEAAHQRSSSSVGGRPSGSTGVKAGASRQHPPGASLTSRFIPWREIGSSSDRKSTRLNSSHLVISYAVFCLKKKK